MTMGSWANAVPAPIHTPAVSTATNTPRTNMG
jgi:hypothetical protein